MNCGQGRVKTTNSRTRDLGVSCHFVRRVKQFASRKRRNKPDQSGGEFFMSIQHRSAAVVAASVLALAAVPQATAQQYPTQSITIVVAAAAGGFADGVARVVAELLGEKLGQKVVVENRGGAGGNLGARGVAQSKPDGHTILVSTTSMAINGTLYKNMGYATSDITPVAIVGSAPEALVVHPDNPAKTLGDFIKAAKTQPIQYGSAGVGSGSYIAAEYLFKEIAKVQTVHVPYPGGAPAITALLGNHINALAATVSPLVPHINSGKLRALGLASKSRHPVVPNVPTYAEAGFPDFYAASWVGFFVPSKTDAAVVAKLNATINEIIKQPGVQQKLARFALEPMHNNVAQTGAFFKSEVDHWGKMVRTLGLSIN
jgi:tripartite-type tricarboxylate transporter receptor subunit TctC